MELSDETANRLIAALDRNANVAMSLIKLHEQVLVQLQELNARIFRGGEEKPHAGHATNAQ